MKAYFFFPSIFSCVTEPWKLIIFSYLQTCWVTGWILLGAASGGSLLSRMYIREFPQGGGGGQPLWKGGHGGRMGGRRSWAQSQPQPSPQEALAPKWPVRVGPCWIHTPGPLDPHPDRSSDVEEHVTGQPSSVPLRRSPSKLMAKGHLVMALSVAGAPSPSLKEGPDGMSLLGPPHTGSVLHIWELLGL